MAIVKMKKLRLMAPKAQKDALMRQLLLLGCVELASQDFMFDDPLVSELISREYSDSTPFRTERQIYATALRVLDKFAPVKTPLLSPKAEVSQSRIMDSAEEANYKAIAKEIGMLEEKLKNLKADEVREKLLIETLTPWKSCDLPLDCSGTKHASVLFGTVPADTDMDMLSLSLSEKTEEAAIFQISEDENAHYLTVFCHRDAEEAVLSVLREHSFAVPAFGYTKGYAADSIKSSMEYLDYVEGDRVRTEARIAELASHREELKLCFDRATARIAQSDAEDLLLSTDSAILLQGWFPAEDEAELKELLEDYDCAYELSDPVEEEYDSVPVKLKNNALTDGLNMVTDMYSLPRYGSVDANPLMAPFFILFYGIMMADMGYGLIMVLAGLLITFKMRPREGFLKYFGELMIEGGIATFVMGAITGGFFGDAPYWVVHILNPDSTWEGLPCLFSPLNDTIMVLVGAIILGFIHLNAGMAVSFYIKKRDGNLADAIFYEGAFWIIFIGAGIMAVGSSFVLGIDAVRIAGTAILILGGVIFFYGSTRGKKGIGKLTAIFAAIYNELTGWFGDLLSYARLMALMLAGSVIAQVFNTLGAMPGNIFIFLIIAIIGNTLNFGLNLLGCYVHDLRLQCLEFFNKFYTDGGKPYRPLKIKSKFFNVTK